MIIWTDGVALPKLFQGGSNTVLLLIRIHSAVTLFLTYLVLKHLCFYNVCTFIFSKGS